MMKMLEDAEGTETTFQVGETKHFEFIYDMDTTFMEDANDLEVAVWAQDYISYEIYNSHFLYEYTDHPYPAQNLQLEGSEEGLQITWEAPAQGAPVGYDVYVNNELKAENTTELSLFLNGAAGLKVVSIIAKYENDRQSVSLAGTIDLGGEEEEIICNAPTNLNATIEQDAEGFDHYFKVTMTWDAADNANEYVVYLDGEKLDTTAETSYIKGFNEEGTHYFTVSSVCDNGESEQSESFEFEIKGESLEEISNNIKIYPNPASKFVKLSAIGGQLSAVKIHNYLGILIEEIEVNSNDIEINVSNYNSGVYFVEVVTEKGSLIKKIVVE
jgi:hypothetical protein